MFGRRGEAAIAEPETPTEAPEPVSPAEAAKRAFFDELAFLDVVKGTLADLNRERHRAVAEWTCRAAEARSCELDDIAREALRDLRDQTEALPALVAHVRQRIIDGARAYMLALMAALERDPKAIAEGRHAAVLKVYELAGGDPLGHLPDIITLTRFSAGWA